MNKTTRSALTSPPKPAGDKITVNLGCIDLGQIDLLVQEGFYSNRAGFIRSAARAKIDIHRAAMGAATARQTLHARVPGLALIDSDVPAALALDTIGAITVLGASRASPEARAALAARRR